MTTAMTRPARFEGFYVGAVLAGILIVSGLSSLIIGLAQPVKWFIFSAINLILGQLSFSRVPVSSGWWPFTAEMCLLGVMLLVLGLRLGGWFCAAESNHAAHSPNPSV